MKDKEIGELYHRADSCGCWHCRVYLQIIRMLIKERSLHIYCDSKVKGHPLTKKQCDKLALKQLGI